MFTFSFHFFAATIKETLNLPDVTSTVIEINPMNYPNYEVNLSDLFLESLNQTPQQLIFFLKGEFQICPHMDFNNILYVEYLYYNNYKNEIISFLEGC